MSAGIFHEFHPFTWFHAVVATVLLGLSLGVSLLGRRWRGTWREIALGAFWGGLIVSRQVIEIVWYLEPERFRWDVSLPLQFCDLAPWFAAIALLTEARWARTLLYYWGIGLSTQAFFTPTVTEGPAYTRFWWFWISHTHIVGSAIYDMIARGYRPSWRDFRVAVLLTFLYTVAMIILDAITGLNYGYVGPSAPSSRTIIDALGPYPWRVPLLMLIAALAFAALTVVWRPASARTQPPGTCL